MNLPRGFTAIESTAARGLTAELARELTAGHPLYGLSAAAVARRIAQDDVLFELLDGSGRVAEVHLTWAANERPPWPHATVFESRDAWIAFGDVQRT
jgi:hypothetical protein